jgi:hypothetical protein
MRDARQSIIDGHFPKFSRKFFAKWYNNPDTSTYPKWIIEAFTAVGVDLDSIDPE